jgi:hypothetical protein
MVGCLRRHSVEVLVWKNKTFRKDNEVREDGSQMQPIYIILRFRRILLPRSVALQSKFNCAFADLTGRLSGTFLDGPNLYDTNADSSMSSGNVILQGLFWIVAQAMIAISVIFTVIKLSTIGLQFLISFALENIESILVIVALGAIIAAVCAAPFASNLAYWIIGLIVGEGGEMSVGSMLSWVIEFSADTIGMICTAAITMITLPIDFNPLTCFNLALGVVSIALTMYATARHSFGRIRACHRRICSTGLLFKGERIECA